MTSTIVMNRSVCWSCSRLRIVGLHGDVERRRRLVGEQQLRSAGQRQGDHHPLAHPAGELVGVLVEAARRPRGCSTERSSVTARAPWRRDGSSEVQAQRLGDLLADRHHRVERAHRVLEDHRDSAPEMLAHLLVVETHQLASRRSARGRSGRRSPSATGSSPSERRSSCRSRIRRRRRASSLAQRQRHPVDGTHPAPGRQEVCLEVSDVEQRLVVRSMLRIGGVGEQAHLECSTVLITMCPPTQSIQQEHNVASVGTQIVQEKALRTVGWRRRGGEA